MTKTYPPTVHQLGVTGSIKPSSIKDFKTLNAMYRLKISPRLTRRESIEYAMGVIDTLEKSKDEMIKGNITQKAGDMGIIDAINDEIEMYTSFITQFNSMSDTEYIEKSEKYPYPQPSKPDDTSDDEKREALAKLKELLNELANILAEVNNKPDNEDEEEPEEPSEYPYPKPKPILEQSWDGSISVED